MTETDRGGIADRGELTAVNGSGCRSMFSCWNSLLSSKLSFDMCFGASSKHSLATVIFSRGSLLENTVMRL